jgi:AcrR family transcriptional regulator
MQNGVLDSRDGGSLVSRSVARTLERRRVAYADEVRRLVEASFELIREKGELEPRVTEIVRAAGLSNQAFYKHFRSKDELLLTVLDEGVRILASYLSHRMDKVASPERKVREWVAGIAAQALDPRAAAATRPFAASRARLSERFPSEVEASERQLVAILAEALEASVARGELEGANPQRDARLVYTLAMGWLQWALAQPEPLPRREARDLVAFALSGLGRARDTRRKG